MHPVTKMNYLSKSRKLQIHKVSIYIIVTYFAIKANALFSQSVLNKGEIHGNFQIDAQFYNEDTLINAAVSPERLSNNAFANLIYTNGDFMAGLRFESYLNTLQGFSPQYNGTGIPYRFATFKKDMFKITAGSFYEQFGSGVLLRSYEERGLGYDNAFDGVQVIVNPIKGLILKSLVGKQRKYFTKGEGIVRGIDGEWFLNETFDSLSGKINISLGGSFVSKYQADENSQFNLPENVAALSGRISIFNNKFRVFGEYAYKINDPSTNNGYIYKPGEALVVQMSYFTKGFGFSADFKRIDNMSFRSERDAILSDVLINYIPAFNRQHTYNLLATLYPYAVQLNGEIGGQTELSYNFPKGSSLGGKYGTKILLNYSFAYNLDTTLLNDLESTRYGYKASFFSFGEQYFSDMNVEIQKKWSKKIRTLFTYANLTYNKDVIEGKINYGLIHSNVGVIDFSYKINSKHNIRSEVQGLFTKQDQGNWGTVLVEYTFAPHWFFAVMDQYNYGNKDESLRLHYFITSCGYMKDTQRISLTYGRQRAGIFCVGGVCRNVPASNGLTLTITSTF